MIFLILAKFQVHAKVRFFTGAFKLPFYTTSELKYYLEGYTTTVNRLWYHLVMICIELPRVLTLGLQVDESVGRTNILNGHQVPLFGV